MSRKISEKTLNKRYKKHVEEAKENGFDDKEIWSYEEFKDWIINGIDSKVAW